MTARSDASDVGEPRPVRSGLGWRLVTATLGIPAILGLIYIGGVPFNAAIVLALVVGFVEYAAALRLPRTPPTAAAAATVAALPIAAAIWHDDAVLAALTLGVVLSLVGLILAGEPPADLHDWALALAGVLYIGLLGEHFIGLRSLDDGRAWVLLAMFTAFATDTGAYASGRLLGRHKLAPRLSPSKTVEGSTGGLLAGALAAWGLNRLLGLDRPDTAMLALGGAAAVAGQLGDLAESLIKRSAGVKDMGSVLPGHGGVLDRLDSLLFVVPLVYYTARWWLT